MREFKFDVPIIKPTPTGRIVPTTKKEKLMFNARTLAAAFWASYFVLHWLLILELTWRSPAKSATTLFFLVCALLLSINIAATEEKKK